MSSAKTGIVIGSLRLLGLPSFVYATTMELRLPPIDLVFTFHANDKKRKGN